eukprot:scaffold2987_cov170-Amphora_coffeaeformis.AAC.1
MLSSTPHMDASSPVDVRTADKSPVKGGTPDNVVLKAPVAAKTATENDAFKPTLRGDESLLKSVEPQGSTVVTPAPTTTESTTATPDVVATPGDQGLGVVADVNAPQTTATGAVENEAFGDMPPVDQTLRDLTGDDLREIQY